MRPHLATLIDEFQRHGNAVAVVTYRGNRRIVSRYAELATLALRFALELKRRNIQKGERVLLWGQNSAQWIGAFFGCVLRGVLVVPLDASGSVEFAERVIAETRPRLILADRSLMLGLADPIPRLALDDLDTTLAAPADSSVIEPTIDLDTPLQILFTSGTTSEPKGVVHTHRNVLASVGPIEKEIQKYLRYERFVHPLRFLHTLPLSHVFGQFMGLWLPVVLAAEVHFESRLQAQRLIEIIRRERISVLAAVPRVLDLLRAQLLLLHPSLKDELQRAQGEPVWKRWWRFRKVHKLLGIKFWAFVCGGASLPAELESFWNTLGFALIQGYGMTETTALITLNHPFKIGKGTIGKPLPGREIRIGDDGEILVRGEMVSTSSWRNGQLTQASDDWLATGDMVRSDAAGQYQFLGRKGQMIVTSSGLNIHPEDVEAVLDRQAGVRASTVVASAMAGGTEAVAVLLFQGNEKSSAAEAVQAANRSLAEYQRIRHWLLWPGLDFPRTSTGKIQRGKVAQWASAHMASENGAGSIRDQDPLLELISRITRFPIKDATNTARLEEDLHLDSLGRVQLQSELEQRFAVALDDGAFAQIETLGALRHLAGLNHQAAKQNDAAENSPITASYEPHYQSVYPWWPWSPAVSALRICFVECVMRPLVWILGKPEVVYEADVPAASGPILIVANHVTAYDAALVLYALSGRMRRKFAIAMAANMLDEFRHGRGQRSWWQNMLAPAAYWLITALFNVFPLPRNAGFRDSFSHMGKAMDRGYNVMIFPEGHRTEGKLQKFRSGIGLLVQESDVPVLPVALQGLGDLKQQKRRWFRSGKLTIRVGVPLRIDTSQPADEIAASLENKLRSMLE